MAANYKYHLATIISQLGLVTLSRPDRTNPHVIITRSDQTDLNVTIT